MAGQPRPVKPVADDRAVEETVVRVTPSMVAAARAQVVIADRLGKQVSAKVRKIAALAR